MKLEEALTFNDILIKPKFSYINSRKDVDLRENFLGLGLNLPVASTCMDSITESKMASTMAKNGAIGILHRFCNVEKNLEEYKNSTVIEDLLVRKPIVSIGLGDKELERASALIELGATHLVIDTAHGAQMNVVNQYDKLREKYGSNIAIIVGNFVTGNTIKDFEYHSRMVAKPDAYRIGIGNGSMCVTSLKTGIGCSQVTSLLNCLKASDRLISDGGHNNAGDISKALAIGAKLVMIGNMFAGTEETPGEIVTRKILVPHEKYLDITEDRFFKKYRGSAAKESYLIQGKTSDWRTPEGESTLISYKGSVVEVLKDIEGGLRSALTYTGSNNLEEFRKNIEFVRITNNGYIETTAHGKLND